MGVHFILVIMYLLNDAYVAGSLNKICPRSRISGCNLLTLEPLESGCTGPVNYGSRHSRNPPVTNGAQLTVLAWHSDEQSTNRASL